MLLTCCSTFGSGRGTTLEQPDSLPKFVVSEEIDSDTKNISLFHPDSEEQTTSKVKK